MAKVFEGSIAVKIINGKNGDFTVGTFETDLGVFKIRDPLLDQFEEGEYQVKAVVEKLTINSYLAKKSGILITNIEAAISSIEVLEERKTEVQPESIEPDITVEDEPKTGKPAPVSQNAEAHEKKPNKPPKPGKIVLGRKAKKQTDGEASGPSSDASDLFGHLWPLGETVSLDMAAPRKTILEQVAELKKLGYKFDATKQRWHK